MSPEPFFGSKFPQTPSSSISLTFLLTLCVFTLFEPKIRGIKWEESSEICLTW